MAQLPIFIAADYTSNRTGFQGFLLFAALRGSILGDKCGTPGMDEERGANAAWRMASWEGRDIMCRSWFISGSVTIILLVCPSVLADLTASFQGLGDLPEGTYESRAHGISADGRVVVGSSQGPTQTAFRWEDGVMTSLGRLPGGSASYARAVSADGSVVAGDGQSASGYEAFRWQGGTMVGLGDLPGDGYTSYGNAISSDGRVVVGQGLSSEGMEAFRWEDGRMVGLGSLSGSHSSRAFGVSADGSVVVGQSNNRAFQWTASDGMNPLSNLPYGGGFSSATAISADGSVIVGWAGDPTDIYGNKEAFRWENGNVIGLGDLPGGLFYSLANDVSADGSVIVGWSTRFAGLVEGREDAFIWDEDHGMRSLLEVLTEEYGLDLTGWKLYNATAISDDGLSIVGFGINPDGYHEGWIARLPEPSVVPLPGAVLLGMLGLGYAGMRLRRQAS